MKLERTRRMKRRWQRLVICILFVYRIPFADCLLSDAAESRDYCLHETFNATCRPGFAVLMTSAVYGRMRIGRCVNGDFNIGCSKDVIGFFDGRCTGREACEVGVRNLVDIHPCQKDFMSYLEAAYKCIEVSPTNSVTSCPVHGKVPIAITEGGHIVHEPSKQLPSTPPTNVGHSSAVGVESCPWVISVRQGQRIQIKIILLPNEHVLVPGSEDQAASLTSTQVTLCSTLFVISDDVAGVTEAAVCSGRSRERHLYTSTGSHVVMYMSRDVLNEDGHLDQHGILDHPRFILNYQAIGCADLLVPPGAWLKRLQDNVMIRCNDTFETWYLTCQGNRWIGDAGNCSNRLHPMATDEKNQLKAQSSFSTLGIILAVLLGVALGVFIGIILLMTVHCFRRRNFQNKETAILMVARKGVYETGTGSGVRRVCRTAADIVNYPALIGNSEKVYNFDTTLYDCSVVGSGSEIECQGLQRLFRTSTTTTTTGCSSTYEQQPSRCPREPFSELQNFHLIDQINCEQLHLLHNSTPPTDRLNDFTRNAPPSGECLKTYDIGLYPPGLRTPRSPRLQDATNQFISCDSTEGRICRECLIDAEVKIK